MASGRPKKVYTEEELYEYAVGALARRMRSVAELKRLLRNKVEADTELGRTLVELIIVRLKDQGYLNDARYAAAYSSFRRDNEKFGRRRVITDLKIKGVHSDVIEKAVATTYEDVNDERLARDYLRRKRLSPAYPRWLWVKDHFHDPEEVGRGRGDDLRTGRRGSRIERQMALAEILLLSKVVVQSAEQCSRITRSQPGNLLCR